MQDVLGKILVVVLIFSLSACASKDTGAEAEDADASVEEMSAAEDSDPAELDDDLDADLDAEATNDPDEKELDADANADATSPGVGGEPSAVASGEPDEADVDSTSSEPSPVAAGQGENVEIVNLRYLANEGGGTVAIETSGPATYRTRYSEQNNQYVIELANARLPEKLRRPFNTKEFGSAVGSIDAYQKAGETTARIVVQLRGQVQPQVVQEGNTLLLIPSGGEGVTTAQDMSEDGGSEVDSTQSAPNDSAIYEERDFESSLRNPTKFYGRPISLQLKEADVRDVLTFIAEESGLNLVVADSVTGKVSLKLRDIPWDHALLVILKTQNLGYVRQGNILRIAPLDKLKEESSEEAKVLESKQSLEPLLVRVLPVSYAVVQDLQTHVKEFLSPRGKVIADKRSQALIVTDVGESLERIGKLVRSLDTPPPQVLIEGKIVEAQDSFSKDIGVNWSMANGEGISLGDGDLKARPEVSSTPAASLLGAIGFRGSLNVGTFEGLGDLDATLILAEREEQLKILSSPRIVTINNEEGEITQETEVPFIRITQGVNGQGDTRSVEFKPAKLTLKVTPQITVDGGVMMLVDVAREFFGAIVDQESQARRLNKRSAKTRILVKNGQTAVLGGIYQSEDSTGTQGVPGLKDIPLIGSLFQADSRQTEKVELLIFLTPRILNYKSAFVRDTKGGKF